MWSGHKSQERSRILVNETLYEQDRWKVIATQPNGYQRNDSFIFTDSFRNVFQSSCVHLELITSPNSWPVTDHSSESHIHPKASPSPIALSPMSWPTQHKVKWLTVSFSFLVLLNLFIYFWFLEAEKCMPFFFFFFYSFAFSFPKCFISLPLLQWT